MRLSADQTQIIKDSVEAVFGGGVTVRLFGSRVDDARRGGDIDLYLEVPALAADQNLLEQKARLLRRLWQRLGPQRIDLLVRTVEQPIHVIHEDATAHGVIL